MGIVREIRKNALGEVTSALVMKGKNREKVFRHATSIIPLLTFNQMEDHVTTSADNTEGEISVRSKRKAHTLAKSKIKNLCNEDLV